MNSRNNLTENNLLNGQQQNQSKSQQINGIGQKVIAGLMVPQQTAQSYAAIAHAAAAAAQSNQQRNNNQLINLNQNHIDSSNGNSGFNTGSVNNLLNGSHNDNLLGNNMKSQSYNNPGFFESASYAIVNLNTFLFLILRFKLLQISGRPPVFLK